MKKLLQFNKLIALVLVSVFMIVGCSSNDTSDTVNNTESAATDNSVTDDAYDDSTVEEADVEEATTEETGTDEASAEETDTEDTSAGEEMEGYPFSFVDKFGNEVIIEKMPESFASFSPEITETLFAIGVGDKVVGRSSYCNYPAETAEVADLGTLFDISMEAVIAAEPEVVFLSSMVSEDVYKMFIDNGLTVVTVDYDDNLDGTMEQISLVGAVAGKSEEADVVNQTIADAIADLSAKAADRDPITLYFAVGVGEYTSTATGDTFMHDIIQTVGAINVAADGTFWMYTVEQIVEDDPDVMICSEKYNMKETIESTEGYKDLRCVTEGNLYTVDEDLFFRQGPRVVDAMYALAEVLYGE